MPSIYFSTPTVLDTDALLVLGVSVKETTGAIGRFGTGLKYAVAWLLRNDHKVAINGEQVKVTRVEIRGRAFDLITFRGQRAGFTTELGRDWEGWMAFRELYANTLDENGSVGLDPADGGTVGLSPAAGGTVIEVGCPGGSEFFQAYTERADIILPQDDPLAVGQVEVRDRPSKHYYVRGVRAGDLPRPALFTWNHLDKTQCMLTEDRLIKDAWTFAYHCEKLVLESNNEDLIRRVVTAPPGSFEGTFSFIGSPGRTFVKVVSELKGNPKLNKQALSAIPVGEMDYTEASIDAGDRKLISRACAIASKVCPISPDEINVTADFGYPQLGVYNRKTGKIWISVDAITRGLTDLTATVLEESIHKHRGLDDSSRGMQEFLLNHLVARLVKEG